MGKNNSGKSIKSISEQLSDDTLTPLEKIASMSSGFQPVENNESIINSQNNLNDELSPQNQLEEQLDEIQSLSTFYQTWRVYCTALADHIESWPEESQPVVSLSFLIQTVNLYVQEKSIDKPSEKLTAKERKDLFKFAQKRRDSILGAPAVVSSRFPAQFLTPIDKASRELFSGELNDATVYQLAMERRGSKREITTLLSINFDELGETVQIKGRTELTAYDREVHDAIVTLYVDGGNKYITPQMIYQTMTGRKNARLMPKQSAAISESISKCIYGRVTIDASEEARAFGFESFKYDGNLIPAERVVAKINGETTESIHLLRAPILYEYASLKNQIGRVDIRLLDTPINKTEEILMLQGYLQRRILSMKGSNLSRNILYDSVYKFLDITAASDGALRLKKSKIRGQIRSILEYWTKEDFINGFTENKRGSSYYSLTIVVD